MKHKTTIQGIRIGELLIEQGTLTSRQVNHILKVQDTVNKPFGDLAQSLYGITPKAVEDAWVEQFVRDIDAFDLKNASFDSASLKLITTRQAWQFHLLPVNQTSKQLDIATDAGSFIRAINFASKHFKKVVNVQIVETCQLREYLMKHYPIPRHLAKLSETL